jgi:hypothetical protein
VKRNRIYIGKRRDTGEREVFRSVETPTEESHGAVYGYAIGAFKTVRAAEYMRDVGIHNPHCLTVSDAERLAKKELKQ